MPETLFRFRFDARFRLPLLPYGVTESRADVAVTDDSLRIRFGPWSVETPRDNVASAEVTGPYHWWKAIGIRMSMVDRGITFGTSVASGACVLLHRPVSVRIGRVTVPLRHPGITLTVTDPGALVAALTP